MTRLALLDAALPEPLLGSGARELITLLAHVLAAVAVGEQDAAP